MSNPCGVCGAPSPFGYLCNPCTANLTADVIHATIAFYDLDSSITRQDVRSIGRDSGHQKAKYTPLPWNETAQQVQDELGGLLRSIGGGLVHDKGRIAREAAEIAHRVRSRADAGTTVAVLQSELRRADVVTGRQKRPDSWPYGPCQQCGTHMYAPPGADWVNCPHCSSTYEGPSLKAAQLESLRGRLGAQSEAATWISVVYGAKRETVRGNINRWVNRGRLLAVNGWVRFSEVEALWVEGERHRVKRQKASV